MGLFDGLLSGGSSGGGLLDFLRNNALNQQMQSGLQSDQAQYGQPPMQAMAQMPAQMFAPNQPSPLDNASWPAGPIGAPQRNAQPSPLDNAQWPYGPNGAPSQANAQMPVPQQPPSVISAQQPMQGSSSSGGLSAGMTGFMNNLHNGPIGAIMGGLGGAMGMQAPAQQAQNVTKQWLMQRGVDPIAAQAAIGNPKVLESLIEQLKPKALISTGAGHLYDPNTKADIKTYEPEDKVPTSALEYNFYKSNLPKGEAPVSYQKWLATKDTDPNKVNTLGRGGELWAPGPDGKPVILHKNEAGSDQPMLSDEGQHLMAERILNGEKGVTSGFARSKGDMAGIYNKVAEKAKERGIDASDILSNINNEYAAASAARSFGGMTAKQETYSNTAAKAIDIAEKASADVPRTSYVPVNKAILAWKEKTGDPKVAALGQSLETLTQEYARAVGGGHGTVSDKEEAREYLAKAQTHDQLVARFNIMRQEIARGREAVGESAAHVGGVYRNNIRRGSALPEPGTKEAEDIQGASAKKPIEIDGYKIMSH